MSVPGCGCTRLSVLPAHAIISINISNCILHTVPYTVLNTVNVSISTIPHSRASLRRPPHSLGPPGRWLYRRLPRRLCYRIMFVKMNKTAKLTIIKNTHIKIMTTIPIIYVYASPHRRCAPHWRHGGLGRSGSPSAWMMTFAFEMLSRRRPRGRTSSCPLPC